MYFAALATNFFQAESDTAVLQLSHKMVESLSSSSGVEPGTDFPNLRRRLSLVASRLAGIEERKRKVDERQDDIDRMAFDTIDTMVVIQE